MRNARLAFSLSLLILTSQSFGADVAPFRMFDRGLNSQTGISYFDHEGNSPFKGNARAKMTFSPEGLHFTFDVKPTAQKSCCQNSVTRHSPRSTR